MDQPLERVAGLDVHRKTSAVGVRRPGEPGERVQHIRPFGTTAVELLTWRDWLEAHRVTDVALESTGVYWKPVFYVLEEAVQCLLVNAQHVQKVPGRKTDVQDCVWLAQLLEHGLLRGSFVPPPPQRELRDLTRYRKVLIQERTREANRLHKVLEDAGIKLATVATDILGVSGRAMLQALLGGTTDPTVLADLARGTLRKKRPALRQALAGRFRPHHGLMVSQHLGHLDEAIDTLSGRVEEAVAPLAAALPRLDRIPGGGRRTAEVLLAEVGVDMRRFPTAAPLASWAGLCPGQNERAGTRRSGRTRPGNRGLRMTLIEAASMAARTRNTAWAARYHRIARPRGHKKAVVAVAHAMLVTAYHLLDRPLDYPEPGADYFDRRHPERATRRAVRALERQGYRVPIEPAA